MAWRKKERFIDEKKRKENTVCGYTSPCLLTTAHALNNNDICGIRASQFSGNLQVSQFAGYFPGEKVIN